MRGRTTPLQRGLWHPLVRLDALFNRLYGSRYNPLYQSGAIVIALLIVVTITGLYLILFYRIGAPYDSVARMTDQVWSGRWIRTLHRYASDAAVVAAAVHALRLFAQGRSWGPRALAWLSGVSLLFLLFVCGWTGYVMIWDVQGQVLAVEGARLLDSLPIFGEPISRAFVGEKELPNAFFFLNLFLHIAVPIGLGLVLWIHVSRVARPTLMPPRPLTVAVVGLLLAISVVWPVGMAAEAQALRLPGSAPFDLFYSFWLPLAREAPPGVVWLTFLLLAGLALAVPWLVRPPAESTAPSSVDERHCTGCEQCYLDCPYDAIAMLERQDHREGLVARVDPALCVSCGICAGSCAPMRVGPPRRTGRDQLSHVKEFLSGHPLDGDDIVVVACDRALPASGERFHGCPVYAADCAGSVHTSVIEYLLRGGAAGVLVVACPPRDCWNREGPRWLEQRLFHDREAELHARVDRRRVRLAYATAADRERIRAVLDAFRTVLAKPEAERGSAEVDLIRMCETANQ